MEIGLTNRLFRNPFAFKVLWILMRSPCQEGGPVRIGPGEEAKVVVHISVRGNPGGSLRETVRFRTNDPRRPEAGVEIVARMEGQVTAVPSELYLGEVPAGETLLKKIEVRGYRGKIPFSLTSVISSHPSVAEVVKSRPVSVEQMADSSEEGGGTLYELEVRIKAPAQAGELQEQLEIQGSRGDLPVLIKVPVRGAVVGKYRFLPRSIIIPRNTESGLVYSAAPQCMSFDKRPFELVCLKAPAGLKVTVGKCEGGIIPVRVECLPSYRGKEGPQVLSMRARRGTETEDVQLTVVYWHSAPR